MTKLNFGTFCYVSDTSNAMALNTKHKYYLIGVNSEGKFVTESGFAGYITWSYAVPIPEAKLIPWTLETCPVPPFCIKDRLGQYRTVLDVDGKKGRAHFVTSTFTYDAQELLSDFQLVNPEKTLSPCGELK